LQACAETLTVSAWLAFTAGGRCGRVAITETRCICLTCRLVRCSLEPWSRANECTFCEIAEAALLLASDAVSFANGVELFADGGAAQV
jgi:hypothetical protein